VSQFTGEENDGEDRGNDYERKEDEIEEVEIQLGFSQQEAEIRTKILPPSIPEPE
jgi:hypothetical protein